VSPAHFEDDRMAVIWGAVQRLTERKAKGLGEGTAEVLVVGELRRMATEPAWLSRMSTMLAGGGGVDEAICEKILADVGRVYAAEEHVEPFVEEVVSAWQARELVKVYRESAERLAAGKAAAEVDEWQLKRRNEIMAALSPMAESVAVGVREYVRALKEWHETAEEGTFLHAVGVGLETVVEVPRGELSVFQAFSSHGKTARAVDMAAMLDVPDVVLVFACEEYPKDFYAKALARATGIPTRDIKRGQGLTHDQIERLEEAAEDQDRYRKWCVIPAHSMDGADIRRYVLRHNAMEPVGAVIVDYAQAMRMPVKNDRPSSILENMESLSELAGGCGLEIPVICMSQMKNTEGWPAEVKALFEGDPADLIIRLRDVGQYGSGTHRKSKYEGILVSPRLLGIERYSVGLVALVTNKHSTGRTGAVTWLHWERETGIYREDTVRQCNSCYRPWLQLEPRNPEICPHCDGEEYLSATASQ
jgi:hypothetical protein